MTISPESLEMLYYLATFAIALIAVLGFVFSQISSKRTSDTLKETSYILDNLKESIYSIID